MLPGTVPLSAKCSPTSFAGGTTGWGSPNDNPGAWKEGRHSNLHTRELWAVCVDEEALKHYPAPAYQDQGTHYTVPGVPEAWEVIEALQSAWPEDVRYHVGNVLKYVFRLGRKQGASVESDLEKIRNYADRALKLLGGTK